MSRPTSLIKIGEAAEILGVHPNTIRRWEREGKIKTAVRFNGVGTRYYDRESLTQSGGQYLTIGELKEVLGVDVALDLPEWALGEPRYSLEEVQAKMPLVQEFWDSQKQ